jgi:hypothetical protein
VNREKNSKPGDEDRETDARADHNAQRRSSPMGLSADGAEPRVSPVEQSCRRVSELPTVPQEAGETSAQVAPAPGEAVLQVGPPLVEPAPDESKTALSAGEPNTQSLHDSLFEALAQ